MQSAAELLQDLSAEQQPTIRIHSPGHQADNNNKTMTDLPWLLQLPTVSAAISSPSPRIALLGRHSKVELGHSLTLILRRRLVRCRAAVAASKVTHMGDKVAWQHRYRNHNLDYTKT